MSILSRPLDFKKNNCGRSLELGQALSRDFVVHRHSGLSARAVATAPRSRRRHRAKNLTVFYIRLSENLFIVRSNLVFPIRRLRKLAVVIRRIHPDCIASVSESIGALDQLLALVKLE